MINLREELTICLMRKGLSMRKVAKILREKGYDIPKSSGLSTQIRNKRVRFETVQEVLDYLGYEICIREKSTSNRYQQ